MTTKQPNIQIIEKKLKPSNSQLIQLPMGSQPISIAVRGDIFLCAIANTAETAMETFRVDMNSSFANVTFPVGAKFLGSFPLITKDKKHFTLHAFCSKKSNLVVVSGTNMPKN